MRIAAIALMLCFTVFTVGAFLLRIWREVRAMDAHLAARGIARLRGKDGRECYAGLLRGVGVCLREGLEENRALNTSQLWLTVTASRDHALVHAGLEVPVRPEQASSAVAPETPLDPAEAERAAYAALEELPQRGIELERSGGLVRVRVAAEATPAIAERVIEVACAWVDQLPPAKAPRTPGPAGWMSSIGNALVLAPLVAFVLGGIGPLFSETIADLLERVCDHGDKLVVFTERAVRGTGYDVYCVTSTGERYGCVAIWSAGYDLFFPFVFAALALLFLARRRHQGG